MNPTWKSTTGSEGSHGYDGVKEYDLSEEGQLFWADWLGPLYEWIPPKLDWLSTDYYNFEDLNRVENNTEIVASLVGYFIGLPSFEFVTNRNMKYIDFSDSLNRLETNQEILSRRYKPIEWRQNKLDWKPNDPFSYLDARRLELNMDLLYRHYKGNAEAIPYCGVFNCGEEVI